MKNPTLFVFVMSCLTLFWGCKDDKTELPPNPFDPYDNPDTNQNNGGTTVDPKSFTGLHQYIFKPTCANSGCHDGTFEPDFRTIESSYNTLVLQAVIKNDTSQSFSARVVPGDLAKSVLWERLINDIDGQSGIMPLAVDQGSDWNAQKQTHLANIKAWIEGGAKDIFGNSPPNADNLPPSMSGVMATLSGSTTPISRDAGNGKVLLPPGTQTVELWFSLTDDQTPATSLTYNKLKLSTNQNDFGGQTEFPLQIVTPLQTIGYFGTLVDYTHKATVNLSTFGNGSQVFFRIYVKDPQQAAVTEIPATSSPYYLKSYFSMQK